MAGRGGEGEQRGVVMRAQQKCLRRCRADTPYLSLQVAGRNDQLQGNLSGIKGGVCEKTGCHHAKNPAWEVSNVGGSTVYPLCSPAPRQGRNWETLSVLCRLRTGAMYKQ